MIYLDYQSTTPVDSEVLKKMLPYFSDQFANASSSHLLGRQSNQTVENCREIFAALIGADSKEIFFTSGATESNHLALLSVKKLLKERNRTEIVVSAIEHKSMLDLVKSTVIDGFQVHLLPVNADGIVDVNKLKSMISERTGYVSIMVANNEIGTVQPIQEIAEICSENGILFHSDYAQGLGTVPLDTGHVELTFASFSAHKVYGPKGVGALYIRGGGGSAELSPMFYGGGQESGLRAGTTNVPGIVGFVEAARIAVDDHVKHEAHYRELCLSFLNELSRLNVNYSINGSLDSRLPNNLNLQICGIESEMLINALTTLSISNGSACTSRAVTPSHVLLALGLSHEQASESVRISFGRPTTKEEAVAAAGMISTKVRMLHDFQPDYIAGNSL